MPPNPPSPPYVGPYKVLQRKEKSFQLQVRNAKDWVSIDRLKPAYLLPDDQPDIQFSRAGRPLRGRHLSLGGVMYRQPVSTSSCHYKYCHVASILCFDYHLFIYSIVCKLHSFISLFYPLHYHVYCYQLSLARFLILYFNHV